MSVSKLFSFWCGIPFSTPIKAPFGSLWALLPEHVSISDTTTNIMFRSISSTHLNWICDEGCFGVHTKWTGYCRSNGSSFHPIFTILTSTLDITARSLANHVPTKPFSSILPSFVSSSLRSFSTLMAYMGQLGDYHRMNGLMTVTAG